jgi:hypothetical protein
MARLRLAMAHPVADAKLQRGPTVLDFKAKVAQLTIQACVE